MPVTVVATMVCDEVRVEHNGKLILIGVYTPNILVPQIPFTFPMLTFFQWLSSDGPGRYSVHARLRHTESGMTMAEATGLMTVIQPGMGFNVVRVENLRIDRLGAFDFVMTIEGQKAPVGIHSFEIALVPRQPGGGSHAGS
jgi:hypothetical protein